MCKQATNLQMFDVIKKQWADLNDIMVLAGCKTTKASEIKKAIQLEIFKSGKRLPNQNYIPIQDLIKYLGVDERRIIKYAKIEHEMMLKEKAAAGTATQD